jgi:chromosome segregation ATPase
VSALTDLREALEALQEHVSAADTAGDELRDALEAARSTLRDAEKEVRKTLAAVTEVRRQLRELCDAEAIDGDAIVAAVDSLGGPDCGEVGVLDDLDSTTDALESAASDVSDILGDEPEQQPQAVAP